MSGSWDNWAQLAVISGQNKASHHAGVYGLDGSCWGATDNVARTIPKDFFQMVNSIMTTTAGGKLAVNGKSFITLRSEPNMVLAKSGAGGIAVFKGNQTYVVSIYDDESVQPANNCLAASNTCDKLKDSGY